MQYYVCKAACDSTCGVLRNRKYWSYSSPDPGDLDKEAAGEQVNLYKYLCFLSRFFCPFQFGTSEITSVVALTERVAPRSRFVPIIDNRGVEQPVTVDYC
jgi:hypothetical protein